MPETGPRTPDPRGHEHPRVTFSAIPTADEDTPEFAPAPPAEHPTTQLPQARIPAAEKPKGPFTWVQDGLTFVGLLPDNWEQHLVKRVIGLPGDHVVCCNAGGQLTVNGTPLGEKYINPAEVPQVRDFDVVVPAGK